MCTDFLSLLFSSPQEDSSRPVVNRPSHNSDPRYTFPRYPSDPDPGPSVSPESRSRVPSSPGAASPLSPFQTLPPELRANGERPAVSPPPPADRGGKPLSPPVSGTRSYGRAAGGYIRRNLERGEEAAFMGAAKNFTLDRIHRTVSCGRIGPG